MFIPEVSLNCVHCLAPVDDCVECLMHQRTHLLRRCWFGLGVTATQQVSGTRAAIEHLAHRAASIACASWSSPAE